MRCPLHVPAVVAAVLTIAGTAHTADVVPTPWPPAFDVTFITNVTDASLGANASLPSLDRTTAVRSVLYYDDAQAHAQRVDHDAGAYECEAFYNTTGKCTLVMNSVGLYRILFPESQAETKEEQEEDQQGLACCLDMPGMGNVPRDWPVQVEGREYVGLDVESVSERSCHHWRWPAARPDTYHHYYEDAENGLPVRWTFPAAEGRQDWYVPANSASTTHVHQHVQLYAPWYRVRTYVVHACTHVRLSVDRIIICPPTMMPCCYCGRRRQRRPARCLRQKHTPPNSSLFLCFRSCSTRYVATETLLVRSQPQDLFQLPSGCAATNCSSSGSSSGNSSGGSSSNNSSSSSSSSSSTVGEHAIE